MKIAVINFSGNVGKTTIARHLLLPRIDGAELFSVESLNAADGESHAMRGRQFGELQELLQTIDNAVVDIGASNVEELLDLMQKYQGSHEDFDAFVVPTVPALKQQQDTIATLVELARLAGVPVILDGRGHAQTLQALTASTDELAHFGHRLYQLNALLRRGDVEPIRPYIGVLEALSRDVRRHLDHVSCALADLQPRRPSVSPPARRTHAGTRRSRP